MEGGWSLPCRGGRRLGQGQGQNNKNATQRAKDWSLGWETGYVEAEKECVI